MIDEFTDEYPYGDGVIEHYDIKREMDYIREIEENE